MYGNLLQPLYVELKFMFLAVNTLYEMPFEVNIKYINVKPLISFNNTNNKKVFSTRRTLEETSY